MKRFSKLNEPFVCDQCGQRVLVAKSTCRNHCPYCLYSKHVDVNPGDRANPCRGLMRPVDYSVDGKKGIVLHFECTRCGQSGRNRSLIDDPLQPDDYDVILKLKAP